MRVGDTSLDCVETEDAIRPRHDASLVSEAGFDAIFERIREQGLPYWADPCRREADRINTWDGGRGVYRDDPDGHLPEIITRPYGSGGTTTTDPHPLLSRDLERD